MTPQQLIEQIHKKQSFLCIGLDSDIAKLPKHLLNLEDPVFEFNKQIIDATHHLCVAYKPNIAFYESRGVDGWLSLQKTIHYLNQNYPEIFTIADAKRGDIGNTSKMYAKAFFEQMDFDSITVAPYMGIDSVKPFLEYHGKWVILLGLTSNEGAKDFQLKNHLFQEVIRKSQSWGTTDNLMFVVGATRGEMIEQCREVAPNHFFLVPGVGAQGGSLEEVCQYGINADCGLLVNSSRGIIFADSSTEFAEKARESAQVTQLHMAAILEKYTVVS